MWTTLRYGTKWHPQLIGISLDCSTCYVTLSNAMQFILHDTHTHTQFLADECDEPFFYGEGLFLIQSKIELNKLTFIFCYASVFFWWNSGNLMKHRHHINHCAGIWWRVLRKKRDETNFMQINFIRAPRIKLNRGKMKSHFYSGIMLLNTSEFTLRIGRVFPLHIELHS